MAAEPQGFDIVRVLWRWKFLPILGALIGMGLGYLNYTQQPPQYASSALVQVITPMPTPSRSMNYAYTPEEVMQVSRQDESLVIGSELVLTKAGQKMIDSNVEFAAGKEAAAIGRWISSGRKLTVTPGAKEVNTTLINISFVCDDPTLCKAVVEAVVQGYEDYLSEEYRSFGDKIFRLMSEAKDKVDKSFEELRIKTQTDRDDADVSIVWTGEGAVNPYSLALQDINSKLHTLASKRVEIDSKLSLAIDALGSDRDPEAILLMLSESEVAHRADPVNPTSEALDLNLATQQLESQRMERTELFRLQMEEQRYLRSVGESHPALSGIRQQIGLVKQEIAKLREAERVQAAEITQAINEKRKKDGEKPVFKPQTAAERLALRVNSMQETLRALQNEEEGLKELARKNEDRSRQVSKAIQDIELNNRQLDMLKSMQEGYMEKINQMKLGPTASERQLKRLNEPKVGGFYGPKLSPYLLGGGAIGFLILAGLAVLLDLADKSFRSPEEISVEIGAPVLGHIPAMQLEKLVKKPNQTVDSSLCTIHHSRGRVSEAYRSIRTGLFFSNRTGDLKVIQVTSPVPGDGKSTLSANLAVTMAQSGRSVLLIDADFRRPRIAKLFNIESDKGMATVVAGACELDEAIHKSSVPFLSIMPGGKRPSNPAELLSSQRFADLLGALKEKFEIIIIDTPPLLAVSDPSAVAAIVDGVVLTMRLRRNLKPLVTRAAKLLESVDANILGTVVNGVSQDAGYGYNYGYRDYRYAYQYRYGYGYKGYGRYGYNYGSKKYLEEAHDVDTDHVFVKQQTDAEEQHS